MDTEFQSAPLPPGIAVCGDAGSDLAGRVHAEPPHPYRTPFARDAARILHTRAFRRLAGKTQVFARLPGDPPGDHFRSRLTHTLEVTQISRTLARALGLNAELAEGLALVHDIGHPPFGHAGEKALDARASGPWPALRPQSSRPAHRYLVRGALPGLSRPQPDPGREGRHRQAFPRLLRGRHPELAEYFLDQFPPIEAQLIDLADEIAYLTADLDDGLDSGILALDEVRNAVPLFRNFHDAVMRTYPSVAPRLAVYEALRRLLNALVTDLMNEVRARVAAIGATWLDEIRRAPARLAGLSPEMETVRTEAKTFLYASLYNSPGMEDLHAHAAQVVRELFAALMADPSLLPEDHQAQIPAQGLARTVADYIAGMTDNFIEQLWARCAAD